MAKAKTGGLRSAKAEEMQVISVCVQYQNRDGYHIFSSKDVYGLYVATKDKKKALDHVAHQIKALLKANKGIEVEQIEASMSVDEFLASLKHKDDVPPVTARTYYLRAAA